MPIINYVQGITDEDYDLFYEIWQEFDPDGTQYIDYKALSEFLDVLEAPLQVSLYNWACNSADADTCLFADSTTE